MAPLVLIQRNWLMGGLAMISVLFVTELRGVLLSLMADRLAGAFR